MKIKNSIIFYKASSIRIIYCLMIFIITVNIGVAQTGKAWDYVYGGDGYDALHDMIEYSDGSIVFLGTQSSNLSGDVSEASNGFSDFWLVKLAPDGTKIWDSSFGGNIIDNGRSLQETSDGGFIMAGYSSSGATDDKTEASFGGCISCYDYWIVKADANGVLQWEETFNADGEDRPFSIIETTDGGFIVGGYSDSNMSGDKSEDSKGDYDYWVIKMDNLGNLEWEKTIGGNAADRLYKIIQTTDDGFLLGGFSESDISGDKTENSIGGFDYWLVKLDQAGTILWDKTYGGDQEDRMYDMVQSADGGFLLGGFSFSDISGLKSTPSQGDRDYWVLKVDFSGNKLWDRTYGGSGRDQFFSIDKSAAYDSYILSGLSRSDSSGHKTEGRQGLSDYWIVHIDAQGDILKDKTYGGADNDNLEVTIGMSDGSFVLGGFSASGISGDKTEDNVGNNDNWLIRLECQDSFSLPNDTTICQADTFLLMAQIPDCTTCCSYEWHDGLLIPNRNDIVSSSSQFHVTVTDGFLCAQADTINIDVYSLPFIDLDDQVSICDGDSILIGAGNAGDDFIWSTTDTTQSIYIQNSGNYSITVTNGNFCSASDQTELIVHPHISNNVQAIICEGDSLFLANAYQQVAGIYHDTLVNFRNCDSVVITDLVIVPIDTSYTISSSCNPLDTGVFISTIINQFGCTDYLIDSIYLSLSDTTYLPTQFTCDPTQAGITIDYQTNQYNCDSLVITGTILLPSTTGTQFETTCIPGEVGISFDTIPNFFGCDSIITINTTLISSTTGTRFETTCIPSEAGISFDTIPNLSGCDSIITVNTTLLPTTTGIQFETTCIPSEAGVSFDTIPNFFGCDSIIAINTSLLPTTTGTRSETTCILQEAGISFDTIPNFFGCDSIITINTSFLQSSNSTQFAASCDPMAVGMSIDTIPNFVGCDSIITTIISLSPTDSTFIALESCDSSLVGTVIDTLTNQFGCDSFVFTITSQLPNYFNTIISTSCDPNDVGISIDTFSNQFGCDSILQTEISLLPSHFIFDTLNTCDPALEGNSWDTLFNQYNCDSIIQTTYLLLESDTNYLEFWTCDPSLAGTEEVLHTNQFNCDSLEIRTTNYIPPDTTYAATIVTCIPDEVGTTIEQLSNQYGCDSMIVQETILEQFSFLWSAQAVNCFGDRNGILQVDSVWEGVSPYVYALEDGIFQTSPVFNNLEAKEYLLRIQDADGCEVEGIVVVDSPPSFQVDLGEDRIVLQGENFELEAQSDQTIESFYWDTISPVPCVTCLNQSLSLLDNAIYGITAISPEGCIAYDQVRILISKERFVFIPTAFSPNEDSQNDLMKIYVGRGVERIKTFRIYDRWGAQVYEANDLDPNTANWGWDGRLDGQKLSPSVFVYYAEIIFQDQSFEIYKGDFVLMR